MALFMPDSSPLIIIGAGGHSVSVANVALASGFRVVAFIDPSRSGEYVLGIRVMADLRAVDNWGECAISIAVGDNSAREAISMKITVQYGVLRFPPLIHPSASIAIEAKIGMGSVVMPNAAIGTSTTIGDFCIVNTNSSIDHDGRMGNFSSLAPGAVTGGRVNIGRRAAISLGAVIQQGVHVGDDAILGANSFLDQNLVNNTVAYGNPAKPMRTRLSNEPYLK